MDRNIPASAYFDALYLTKHLGDSFEEVHRWHVHLFSYLGCLLALYQGRPAADWGYTFTSTEHLSPFALDINNAVDRLLARGHLKSSQSDYMTITESGRLELDDCSLLHEFRFRRGCLDGAVGALLALPLGIIREALLNTPDLGSATKLSSSRHLLEASSTTQLHQQFSELSAAIGLQTEELFVPAVLWLSYLDEASRHLDKNGDIYGSV